MQKSKISLVILLGLAVAVTSLVGCGRKELMNVNGEKVKYDDFYARLQNVPVSTPQGVKLAGQYVVEQIVSEEIMLQLAAKEKVEPTEKQVDKRISNFKKKLGGKLQSWLASQGMTMDDLKRKMKVEQALVNLATKATDVPESEVKQAYEQGLKNPNSGLTRPEQIKASVVIASSKENIDKAYKLLAEGTDFGTVAMRLSESPTKQNQGLIGWVGKNDQPQVIADAVWGLQINKFSKPIALDDQIAKAMGGKYMIIKAGQKRPANTQTYKEVQDNIREQIVVYKGGKKVAEQLQRFTKDADITVGDERYKKIVDKLKKDASEALEQLTGTTPVAKSPEK